MSANTAIEWTDHSWSPWWGCTKVSVGDKGACEHCYAETMANRFGVGWGPHAPRKLMSPAHWLEPARWNRKAEREGTRPFVFPSMCDPFDNAVDSEWRRWFFARMRTTPALVWLLLTKRPQNIQRMSEAAGGLPDNAALGCTVVTQAEADRDVPHLLAAETNMFRFVSVEPMLGPIRLDLCDWDGATGLHFLEKAPRGLDWVICGGESGPHARPSHPAWFRSLREQCAAACVPFHFKQWGEWAPPRPGEPYSTAEGRAQKMPAFIVADDGTSHCFWNDHAKERFGVAMRRLGKATAGRLLDGREHNGFPAGFRDR